MRASFLTFSLGAASVALVVAACGSETAGGAGDAGPSDAAAGDSANDVLVIIDAGGDGDADPPADGPFSCGSTTCGATQFCVNPCCGGAKPQCLPNPDGGACATGFHKSQCIGGQEGCEEDACKPPPPYCIDDPSKAPVGCTKQGHSFSCMCA